MARTISKMLVLAVGIVLVTMLFTGCEEEQKISDTQPDLTPDAKRSRLIAVENAQLKQQIEKLKQMHAGEMQRQQNKLDSCLQAKAAVEEISKKGVESYMQDIVGPLTEENAKLQAENKALKTQIEQLKTELEEARK